MKPAEILVHTGAGKESLRLAILKQVKYAEDLHRELAESLDKLRGRLAMTTHVVQVSKFGDTPCFFASDIDALSTRLTRCLERIETLNNVAFANEENGQ